MTESPVVVGLLRELGEELRRRVAADHDATLAPTDQREAERLVREAIVRLAELDGITVPPISAGPGPGRPVPTRTMRASDLLVTVELVQRGLSHLAGPSDPP